MAVSLFAGTAFAQENALPPPPQPSPAVTPIEAGTPRGEIAAFFGALQEKKLDAAYERLLKGSNIAQVEKDVRLLKSKTGEVIDQAGDIVGFDLAREEKVGGGEHLVRYSYLSLGRKFPILWSFTFYRAEVAWKLIDIRFSDSLPAYFDPKAAAELKQ